MGLFGLFSNKKKETLDKGLEKTKESVFGKLARAVAGKSTVDDDVSSKDLPRVSKTLAWTNQIPKKQRTP